MRSQTILIWPQGGKVKKKRKKIMNYNKHAKKFIFHDHLTK